MRGRARLAPAASGMAAADVDAERGSGRLDMASGVFALASGLRIA